MLKAHHVEELADPSALIASLLADGFSVSFEAHGSSMLPTIEPGDKLLVTPVVDVSHGDVVLVMLARGLTAHRVVGLEHRPEGTFVTARGDNSTVVDPEVELANLLGVVTSINRRGESVTLERRSRPRVLWAKAVKRVRAFVGFLIR